MSQRAVANRVLFLNTLAFAVCFGVWTLYGVLVTFIADSGVMTFDRAQMGWLLGVPILTGAVMRLPVGMLCARYGGKPVYIGVMLVSAVALFLTSFATTYAQLLWGGFAFGIAGASFAVGIAYSSIWFPRESQGTALGIFGMGNVGTAATSFAAPLLLQSFTNKGANPEAWRQLPQLYAAITVAMVVVFALFTVHRKDETAAQKTWGGMLAPLRDVRVWRFGLYYFLVFGGFVALAQWLIPYYLNVYDMPLATAGLMAAMFSLPSGLSRSLGGWIADRIGARTTMYWVLSSCAVFFLLLVAPRMEIRSPGEGVLAERAGKITSATPDRITLETNTGTLEYPLKTLPNSRLESEDGALIFPTFTSWQEPIVKAGDEVKKRTLLARGTTEVFFQANVWVFSTIVLFAGIMMGVGMAAVYRHIPDYFPHDVGVVGGIVGVLGGLGGFFFPIIFGYLLKWTGLWTTCWLFLMAIALICLIWMHIVILRMSKNLKPAGPLDRH